MTATREDGFNPWGSGPDPIELRDLTWSERALYDLPPLSAAAPISGAADGGRRIPPSVPAGRHSQQLRLTGYPGRQCGAVEW